MKLEDLLSEKKAAITNRWFDAVVASYPEDSSGFMAKRKDPFTNPVGHTIRQGIEGILGGLLDGLDYEKISPFLDEIIRVRAVQDFTPSQAVSFILLLKGVIREELLKDEKNAPWDELPAFESKIDGLLLFSFDIFVGCREKIYEIKANELRRMTFRLLQRVNVVDEDESSETGTSSGDNDNA